LRKNLAVFNSNGINRYGMVFTIEALASALEQSWEIGVPSFISHDCHRPIAWSKGLSLYLESGMVRLAGIVFFPDSEEDRVEISKATKYALGQRISEYFSKYQEGLERKIPGNLLATAQPHVASCAALIGDNLAAKCFPDIFSRRDKDGLIALSELNPIAPGVFEHDGLLVFAHHFFRRSLSRLNSLNESFLKVLQELSRNQKIHAKISLDPDMVGLAKSHLSTIELEYWWGPKFDDNLSKIPPGVTTHKANEQERLFHGISRTEIWWHLQNQRKTLECEELRDIPSFGVGMDKFGCRYVHSIIDPSTSEPFHLDGAIRLYDEVSMIERLDKDISRSGRNTDYSKLWRLDGALDIESWKKAITHYYRDNPLVGDYLGGGDSAELLPQIIETRSNSYHSHQYIPCEIKEGSGVRVSVSYQPAANFTEQSCYVISFDSFLRDTTRIQYIESDMIELCKFVARRGGMITLPPNIALVAFEDMVNNFPLLQHTGQFAVQSAQKTHAAIKELCDIWAKRLDNRIVTYNIGIQYEHKNVCFSIAGHVNDLSSWHASTASELPESEEGIGIWCDRANKFLSSKYPTSLDIPPIGNLLKQSGLLVMQRKFLDPNTYKLRYDDKLQALVCDFCISKDQAEPIAAFRDGHLKLANAYLVHESSCSRCKSLYALCRCSKYLEEEVQEIMQKIDLLGPFWTTRPA